MTQVMNIKPLKLRASSRIIDTSKDRDYLKTTQTYDESYSSFMMGDDRLTLAVRSYRDGTEETFVVRADKSRVKVNNDCSLSELLEICLSINSEKKEDVV